VLIVGLTGSIGMGKTTTAAMFRAEGVPVFDADAEVHRLYEGPAAAAIEAAFPGTTEGGAVDRARLGAAVLGKAAALERLESIIHPLVQEARARFVAAAGGSRLRVLDIPLLFETGADAEVDLILVVSAAPEVQRARVMARPGMTAEKLELLLARQLPDAQKRSRAHLVIDTGRGFDHARKAVQDVIRALAGAAAGRVSSRRGGGVHAS